MRQKKSAKFFTDEEKNRIKEAINAAESKTAGEIAIMIVDESDEYKDAELLGSILFSGFIALIITVYALHSSLWLYIPTVFILCFPLKGLFRFLPAMKLPFVSTKRMEKKAMERAIRGFYEKGLYKTRQHTGVLFFISIFERKVWIIADKGIYSKIAQGELNRFAEEISNGIKAGRACDALCVAISEIGKILERHFPTSKNDVNELTDEIIME